MLFGVQENVARIIRGPLTTVVGRAGPSGGGGLQPPTFILSGMAGFATGGLLSPVVCPLEAIKCRAQQTNKGSGGAFTGLLPRAGGELCFLLQQVAHDDVYCFTDIPLYSRLANSTAASRGVAFGRLVYISYCAH
jgi:hypothetical protein